MSLRRLPLVLLLVLSWAGATASANPWENIPRRISPWDEPYRDGIGLWHFDQAAEGASPGAAKDAKAAKLGDGVSIDGKQKMHGPGSLRLSGGTATIEGVPWGDRSIELFLRLAEYPAEGKKACLFSLIDPKAPGRRALELTVDHRGLCRLEYEYSDHKRARYQERAALEAPGHLLAAGKWTHLHVSYTSGVSLRIRLSVDGEIAEEGYAGQLRGGTFRMVLGNRPTGDAPLLGWVDELRVARDDDPPKRSAPDDWTDPQAKRAMFANGDFFPVDALTFHATFDGTLEARLSHGVKAWRWGEVQADVVKKLEESGRKLKPRFGPGMRGRALELGSPLEVPAAGLLKPESGAVAFWFRYDGKIESVGRLFKLGGWDFMISGGHGVHIQGGPLKTGGRAAGRWWNLGTVPPGRWHQVVLAWRGEWVDGFVDGEWRNTFLVRGGLGPLFEQLGDKLPIGIGDAWTVYAADGPPAGHIDEYMLFGRYVGPEEVANLYRWARGEKPQPLKAKYSRCVPYPGKRKIVVHASSRRPGEQADKGWLAELVSPTGKVVATTDDAAVHFGWAEMVLQYPLMPAGTYTVRVRQAGADGQVPAAESFTYEHADHVFLRDRAGISDRVLPHWTPVKATPTTVEVWNRRIELDGLALPASIRARDGEVLAGGAYIEIARGDDVRRLAPEGTAKLLEVVDHHAVHEGSLAGAGVALSVRCRTEYDGVSRYTLGVSPGPGGRPVLVDRMTLVLPVRDDGGLLLYALARHGYHDRNLACAVPAKTGRVFGSHMLPACRLETSDPLEVLAKYRQAAKLQAAGEPVPDGLKSCTVTHTQEVTGGNFIPFCWLGTPERGLCWFADTDEGWVRGDADVPAVEVRRVSGKRVELRVNLIARRTELTGRREIVFGLLATPARPLKPGWRRVYWQRPWILGFSENWPAGRQYQGVGCLGAYLGEPYPMDWDRAQWYAGISARDGSILVPYMESIGVDRRVVPPGMWFEWRRQPIDEYYRFLASDPALVDWFAWHYKRYAQYAGINGAYWDCIYFQSSMDPYNHGAWRDAEGLLQGSYYLWGLREMFRRYRTVLLDAGVKHPWIQIHMTAANKFPAFAYADVTYDGEGLYQKPDSGKDFMDLWAQERLMVVDSPHTLGVPTRFIDHVRHGKPEDWQKSYKWAGGGRQGAMRTGIAALLLVDCFSDSMGWPLGSIRQAMFDWGVAEDDCRFVGHWTGKLRSSDASVKVSAWRRDASLLLVAANYAKTPKTVEIRFRPGDILPDKLDTLEAAEIETRPAQKNGKRVEVPLHEDLLCEVSRDGEDCVLKAGPLGPRDFRLIRIGRREPLAGPADLSPILARPPQQPGRIARDSGADAGPARIARLIGELADAPSAFRDEPGPAGAARELALSGGPAVGPLIQALRHWDYRVRANAARALGAIGDPAAAEPLARQLADDLWRPAICARFALEVIGEPAVDAILGRLASAEPEVRERAAAALGHIGSAKATDALCKTLAGDDDGFVRATAAWSLGRIGDPRALEAMKKAASDKHGTVRQCARRALLAMESK